MSQYELLREYSEKLAYAITEATSSGLSRFSTEVAYIYVDYCYDGVEARAELLNAPAIQSIEDSLITVYYKEEDFVPDLVVKKRKGDKDVPIGRSMQESGEKNIVEFLFRQLSKL